MCARSIGAPRETRYGGLVTTDSAAWTRTFWNALAVCTWSLKQNDDDADLWGWRVAVTWEPGGGRGAITVAPPPTRWRRSAAPVASIPIYANFDPIREAREIAEFTYQLASRQSA
jgi:hypothetical protein